MGIREKLNQNSGLVIAATCTLILLAVTFSVVQVRGGGQAPIGMPAQMYFTTDEGKTWFPADITNVPPFTKDGKEAVRAHVYRTSKGTVFVALLERYTPAGKKGLEKALKVPPREGENPLDAFSGHVQWKKPGGTEWINVSDPRANEVGKIVAPDGSTEFPNPVMPH